MGSRNEESKRNSWRVGRTPDEMSLKQNKNNETEWNPYMFQISQRVWDETVLGSQKKKQRNKSRKLLTIRKFFL